MNGDLELREQGLQPVDETTRELLEDWFVPGDLYVLSQYSTRNDSHSWYCCGDLSIVWDDAGGPQLVAIAVERDHAMNQIRVTCTRHALEAAAHAWLIERGCPADPLLCHVEEPYYQPSDEQSLHTATKLRESGTRYAGVDSYSSSGTDGEVWQLVTDAQGGDLPVRLFVETFGPGPLATLREGAFADDAAAYDWLHNRPGPLPDPPEELPAADRRCADAALARTHSGLPVTLSPAGDVQLPLPAVGLGTGRAR
ncbi:glycosyl hydrolase [Streptacidiphilus sp. PB12-B1b]|uniref:glycosyl hydrolase n=1 Tax=Streptacidiphilus sp. PB12-B1b TaxID=2705012 RepID=UPI0015FC8C3E|nr:glycosyl hydrolase [Streptacidiphilus sp. PB12-B1b]QMU79031.1 glycosyl hydrolase [Streptacidiphilus sp. PB12-B1b]